MNVHEYQAKAVLGSFGVPVPAGGPATTVAEATAIAAELGGDFWVVKAQIHAGGRGKGRFVEASTDEEIAAAASGHPLSGDGGVRLTRSMAEVQAAAKAMLGNTLVTKQTSADGQVVRTIYVTTGCDIAKEFYLAMLLDRGTGRVVVMASQEGGVDIEDVAASRPEAIVKVRVDPGIGITGWQARKLAFSLGLSGKSVGKAVRLMQSMYRCYVEKDVSMMEINPLVLTGDGDVVALDAKVSFDENAMFRHKDIAELRDLHEEDPSEIEAGEYNLSYVKLDGNIGCLVNGAGLAMGTMDIIKLRGGEPANFLDVGGGADQEQVAAAFRIITKDPNVKGILVNIFGGIMKCDVIARGVIAAVEQTGLQTPLVVRLAGTNADLGKEILAGSGLNIIPATTLDEAATAIVQAISA